MKICFCEKCRIKSKSESKSKSRSKSKSKGKLISKTENKKQEELYIEGIKVLVIDKKEDFVKYNFIFKKNQKKPSQINSASKIILLPKVKGDSVFKVKVTQKKKKRIFTIGKGDELLIKKNQKYSIKNIENGFRKLEINIFN